MNIHVITSPPRYLLTDTVTLTVEAFGHAECLRRLATWLDEHPQASLPSNGVIELGWHTLGVNLRTRVHGSGAPAITTEPA